MCWGTKHSGLPSDDDLTNGHVTFSKREFDTFLIADTSWRALLSFVSTFQAVHVGKLSYVNHFPTPEEM